MTTFDSSNDIEFGGPATYRIVIQGALDQKWSERLAGMTITSKEPAPGHTRTMLVGHIRDQVELIGVLDTLHELHLPILEVKKVRDRPSVAQGV